MGLLYPDKVLLPGQSPVTMIYRHSWARPSVSLARLFLPAAALYSPHAMALFYLGLDGLVNALLYRCLRRRG